VQDLRKPSEICRNIGQTSVTVHIIVKCGKARMSVALPLGDRRARDRLEIGLFKVGIKFQKECFDCQYTLRVNLADTRFSEAEGFCDLSKSHIFKII
jgi:hypothetical protein